MCSATTMSPFTVLLVALASSGTIAQQGQIQYNDNTGVKVDWRYFAPQTEWNSRLENSQRSQRAEGQTSQPHRSQYQTPQYQTAQPQAEIAYASQQQQQQQQLPVYQSSQAQSYPSAQTYQTSKPVYQSAIRHEPVQLKQSSVQPSPQSQLAVQQLVPANQNAYKPFSAVPSSIKQLLFDVYKPQRPYVDPSAFVYNLNFAQPQSTYDHQQSATAEYSSNYEEPSYQNQPEQKLQTRRDYSDRQGRIEYKDEQYQQQQQQQQLQQQQQQQPGQVYQLSVPFETTPYPSVPRLSFHKGTPAEIQQLLQYQAQLPYDVTANRIAYTPKQPFVPKPFNDEENSSRGPYYYRSKVYYSDSGESRPDYEASKPVEEKEAP